MVKPNRIIYCRTGHRKGIGSVPAIVHEEFFFNCSQLEFRYLYDSHYRLRHIYPLEISQHRVNCQKIIFYKQTFYFCRHRKLQQKLRTYNVRKAREVGEPWLEIIVGAGHHSKGKVKERQKIRPKVEEYLKGKKIKFSPVNKGALVVTFEPYAGEEPCYGEYYCSKCDNVWRNDRSWIGKWQACNSCYERSQSLEKCYPLKQRPRRKQQRYNSNVPPRNKKRNGPGHVQILCQKCSELGRPCPRASVSRFQY